MSRYLLRFFEIYLYRNKLLLLNDVSYCLPSLLKPTQRRCLGYQVTMSVSVDANIDTWKGHVELYQYHSHQVSASQGSHFFIPSNSLIFPDFPLIS